MFNAQASIETPHRLHRGFARPRRRGYRGEHRTGSGRFVIVCDHASNHVPPQFREPGPERRDVERHIAWDPGALGVSRLLAERLDATLVLQRFARCSSTATATRHGDADSGRERDDAVPGNRALDAADVRAALRDFHAPFHAAIDDVVAAKARRRQVALVGLHTFNPVYNGKARPWDVGILFDRDTSLSAPLLSALRGRGGARRRREPALQPERSGVSIRSTVTPRRKERASVMIEIRNDLVRRRDPKPMGRRGSRT